MDYNTKVIIANENNVMKFNGWKPEVNFALHRGNVEVVLYLKIVSSPTLTSVESFMVISRIAQSWLLAA